MDEPIRGYDRMKAGLTYKAPDMELELMQALAAQGYQRFNETVGNADMDFRRVILREELGAFGESFCYPPIRWEYGSHIFVGDTVLINSDCIFMDGADIVIGDRTLIAPRCMFITAGHPIVPEERIVRDPETGAFQHGFAVNRPIQIGSDCWLGANVLVLAGVTIGDGTTVGAGSVVTKSLPPRVLAAGNPARVIRSI